MKVSIITSCFNRVSTIEGAIKSVLKQDYPEIEYIIVDGASKDGTLDVIKKYYEYAKSQEFKPLHPKFTFRYISEPDHGMYEGINKGLRMATGDIIGLLHSDDFLYSNNTVDHIVSRFQQTNADIIYGNGLFVNYYHPNKIVRNWISGKYAPAKIVRGWLPLHPTVYITREWLQKCGFYDESYKIAADSDWLVRSLYDMRPKVSYLNEYIVRMRMGGLSTNPQKIRQKWEEDIRLYRSHKIHPYFALSCKILSKVPQFISAKFINKSSI